MYYDWGKSQIGCFILFSGDNGLYRCIQEMNNKKNLIEKYQALIFFTADNRQVAIRITFAWYRESTSANCIMCMAAACQLLKSKIKACIKTHSPQNMLNKMLFHGQTEVHAYHSTKTNQICHRTYSSPDTILHSQSTSMKTYHYP